MTHRPVPSQYSHFTRSGLFVDEDEDGAREWIGPEFGGDEIRQRVE